MKRITRLLVACSLLGSISLASCSISPEDNIIQNQDKNIVSISIKEGSVPDKIYVGEFDNAGIKLIVKYSDDTSEEISVTSAMLPDDYKSMIQTPGNYRVEIFYRNQRTVLRINIVPKDLTVNFYAYVDTNEYTLIDSQIIPYRHDAVAPSVVNEFYYNGIHYRYDKWDVSFKDVRLDTNVYAQYNEIEFYNVTFYNGNGNVIDSQRIDRGQDAVEPTEEMRNVDGYTFVGWDRSYLNVTKDLSIYGLYKKVVSNVAITNITINNNQTVILGVGGQYQLDVSTNKPNANLSELVWKSLDENIATVENGLVTAHAPGNVTISVANDYVKASCLLIVKNLGNRENPLTVDDAMVVMNEAYDANQVIMHKLFIKGRISNATPHYNESSGSYSGFNIYNLEQSHSLRVESWMPVDESVEVFDNISNCDVIVECWAKKINNDYNERSRYTLNKDPEDNDALAAVHEIVKQPLQSLSPSYEKVLLSSDDNGFRLSAYASPNNPDLGEGVVWTSSDESIVSIESSGDSTYCLLKGHNYGTTTVTATCGSFSFEVEVAVANLGKEDEPISIADYLNLYDLYSDYHWATSYVVGTITKVRSTYYEMSDGNGHTMSFTYRSSSRYLYMSSETILRVYDGTPNNQKFASCDVVSSTGGVERTIIETLPSEALAAAKQLPVGDISYDYYSITGYICAISGQYHFLSDLQEEVTEYSSQDYFTIYRLSNYADTSHMPLLTKINIVCFIYNYQDTYYENESTESVTGVEPAPSTDLIVPSEIKVEVGKEKTFDIFSVPSYLSVNNYTCVWESEEQTVASIDENHVIHGLQAGQTNLIVSYEGIEKTMVVKVFEAGTFAYEKCSGEIGIGTYVISTGLVIAQYKPNNTRIGFMESEVPIEELESELDSTCEWEIVPVDVSGTTMYSIKNVGSSLYLCKGSNSVTYSANAMDLWKIEEQEDGSYEITNYDKAENGDYNPHLRYNAGVGYGCYHGQLGTTPNLYIKR